MQWYLVSPPLSGHFNIIRRSLKGSFFSVSVWRKSWFLRCLSSLSPLALISMMWIIASSAAAPRPRVVLVGERVIKCQGWREGSHSVNQNCYKILGVAQSLWVGVIEASEDGVSVLWLMAGTLDTVAGLGEHHQMSGSRVTGMIVSVSAVWVAHSSSAHHSLLTLFPPTVTKSSVQPPLQGRRSHTESHTRRNNLNLTHPQPRPRPNIAQCSVIEDWGQCSGQPPTTQNGLDL